jgi:hypothetical protein
LSKDVRREGSQTKENSEKSHAKLLRRHMESCSDTNIAGDGGCGI